MVVMQRQTKVPPSSVFFVCRAKVPHAFHLTRQKGVFHIMPKTLLEKIVFTIVMACIMV